MRFEKLLRFVLLTSVAIAGHSAMAQELPAPNAPRVASQPSRVIPMIVDAGSGRLIQLPSPAATILAADPRIARVQPASPTSIFIMGVMPGRTTVIAAADNGTPIAEYDVTIRPGSGAAVAADPNAARAAPSPGLVESAVRRSLPGMGAVHVTTTGRNSYLMSGTVANALESQRAEAVARATAGENREVINNLSLLSATQVNVRVRVAEISRQITRELGFNWQALGRAGSFMLGLRTGSNATTVVNAITGGAISSGYGAGVTTGRLDINSVIDALAADQLITILAEPNLTAQSGETASFLAGGEFPVPTGTSGSSNTITVEFKQFGVSLSFVPTVLGPDRLNLRIRPEVSQLSTTGSVTLPLATGSVTIPALQVRRAETTVELGTGQCFAIAGLLQRNTTQSGSSILGLGDLPVIGALFRSDSFQRNETELVIIVTPYLVQPISDPNRLGSPRTASNPPLTSIGSFTAGNSRAARRCRNSAAVPMLASLFNRSRMSGRLGLLLVVTTVTAAGCSDAGYDRPGTWKPTGVNDQNLRAMLVNPQDAYSGTGALTSRGDNGSRAVGRLLADRRRPLLDASVSRVAPTSGGGGADSGAAPASSGPPGGTP